MNPRNNTGELETDPAKMEIEIATQSLLRGPHEDDSELKMKLNTEIFLFEQTLTQITLPEEPIDSLNLMENMTLVQKRLLKTFKEAQEKLKLECTIQEKQEVKENILSLLTIVSFARKIQDNLSLTNNEIENFKNTVTNISQKANRKNKESKLLKALGAFCSAAGLIIFGTSTAFLNPVGMMMGGIIMCLGLALIRIGTDVEHDNGRKYPILTSTRVAAEHTQHFFNNFNRKKPSSNATPSDQETSPPLGISL